MLALHVSLILDACSSSQGGLFSIPPAVPVMVDKDEAIWFQACNPKRPKTAAWQRYEKYKAATTVSEAKQLGARTVDIDHDLKHCYASWRPHQDRLNEAAEASLHAASSSRLSSPALFEKASGEGDDNRSAASLPHEGGNDSDMKREIAELKQERQQQAEQIQALQAQLQAERMAVSRLQGEVDAWQGEALSLRREIAEIQLSMSRKIAEIEQDQPVESQSKASKLAAVELALNACDHIESRASAEQLQEARAWVVWMGDHLPPDILQQHRPRVLAALLLHAAWCMEWEHGFPFAKCLAWLVECTRNGRSHDPAFPQRAPLLAMRFLNLSAADCGKAAQLHCKLLMLLGRSAPRGLPGRDNDDAADID